MSQQINLASPQLLKPRHALGLREMVIGLGVILAAMLAWSAYVYYQASVQEQQAEQQEALQASAQQALDELTAAALRGVSPLLTAKIKSTQAQLTQRELLLEAVRATLDQTSSGFSPRLRALAHSNIEGVWLNGLTLTPGYVEIKGSVLNAGLLTTYLDRLGKQAPFSGTTFSGMTATQITSTDNTTATDKTTTADKLPDHLDFSLYAGRAPEKVAGPGARQ